MVENLQWLVKETGKCALCGKSFYKVFGGDWGYEYRGKLLCSYHCMRAMERADKNSRLHIQEEEKRQEQKREEERKKISEQLEEQRQVKTAARATARYHQMSKDEEKLIAELWMSGKPISIIERVTKRSNHAIRRLLKEKGLREPHRRRAVRVSEEQIQQIRELAQRGMSNQQIADITGFCTSTICHYKQ